MEEIFLRVGGKFSGRIQEKEEQKSKLESEKSFPIYDDDVKRSFRRLLINYSVPA